MAEEQSYTIPWDTIRKAPEVDEEQVKDLHAKIGELAVANDFLARKLKPWTGK